MSWNPFKSKAQREREQREQREQQQLQKDQQLWNAAKDDKQAEARSLLAAGANPDGHKDKVSRPTD